MTVGEFVVTVKEAGGQPVTLFDGSALHALCQARQRGHAA